MLLFFSATGTRHVLESARRKINLNKQCEVTRANYSHTIISDILTVFPHTLY